MKWLPHEEFFETMDNHYLVGLPSYGPNANPDSRKAFNQYHEFISKHENSMAKFIDDGGFQSKVSVFVRQDIERETPHLVIRLSFYKEYMDFVVEITHRQISHCVFVKNFFKQMMLQKHGQFYQKPFMASVLNYRPHDSHEVDDYKWTAFGSKGKIEWVYI